ncbi:MAG: 6-phosphogluconolactonase [Chlamydiae bacterium]|nr:6-phosphogluconolactonase [Chlamydiota bacterium]
MSLDDIQKNIHSFDERRDLALAGDYEETLSFCVDYFLQKANEAIAKKGFFTIALSGGNTPKAILKKLTQPEHVSKVDWDKIYFFFGDERSVPPDHNDSNYKMVMDTALTLLDVPPENIHRMVAEIDGDTNAELYEKLIREKVPEGRFDLITLGMGDDGHTASLFPKTQALTIEDKWVVLNEVPQKETSRMTFTYPLINQAHNICFFVLGKGKEDRVASVLQGEYQPLLYPSQKIGTSQTHALWILDQDAATQLKL